jgi:hypothetical protein
MLEAQSAGLGIKAGDQQYVTGTLRVPRRKGPSVDGTGSSSKVSLRHLLTRSPILKFYISPDLKAKGTIPDNTYPCHVRNSTMP